MRERINSGFGRPIGIVKDAYGLTFLEAGRIGSRVRADRVFLARPGAVTEDGMIDAIPIAVFLDFEIAHDPLGSNRPLPEPGSVPIEQVSSDEAERTNQAQARSNEQEGAHGVTFC